MPDTFRRRSVRLPGYPYAAGTFFITLCTHKRRALFGVIRGEEMVLNDLGKMVASAWSDIPSHHSDVVVDAFVIMPDHFHGILALFTTGTAGCAPTDNLSGTTGCAPTVNLSSTGGCASTGNLSGTGGCAPTDNEGRGFGHVEANTLPVIVRSFKSSVSREARPLGYQQVWQRGYFEHVIRHSRDYELTCHYIATNIARWVARQE